MKQARFAGLNLALLLCAGPARTAPHSAVEPKAQALQADNNQDQQTQDPKSTRERHKVEQVEDDLADTGPGDGVYGRFDGNFSFAAGLGAAYHSSSSELLPAVRLSTKFYQTVGLYAAFAQAVTSDPPLVRDLDWGLTIEPLFLLRFSRAGEWGRAFWDLTLDSLSLSVGAHAAEPAGGNWGDTLGFCLGLGAGFPLLARAPGPWMRVRGAMQTGADHVEGTAEVFLEWQWMVSLLEQRP